MSKGIWQFKQITKAGLDEGEKQFVLFLGIFL